MLFYLMLAMMMVPGMMLIIPQFMVAKSLNLLNKLHGLVGPVEISGIVGLTVKIHCQIGIECRISQCNQAV